ncbi:hypothetical protein K9M06_06165 [Candidatus Bipolaricaulota bacterium]|nr:hypothetical protein [Candidatus Bipolaricaulota bacterium]
MESLKRSRMGILILALLLLAFSVVASGAQEEDCCLYMEKPDCPPRYTSFNPSEDTYGLGETITLALSGLDDEYKMEEIKIQKVGSSKEVVYTEVINQDVSKDMSEWQWQWNQKGDSGEQVDTGHYFALLETQCCGIYRTDFRVQYEVRAPRCSCCCGGFYTRLDTTCNRYETGENITVSFSNCGDCNLKFEKLYVKKNDRCCGGEIVFSREFTEDFAPGRDWNWVWDQQNNNGQMVEPGRYTVTIETQCCGSLSTTFFVNEARSCCQSSSSCCGGGLWPFFSCTSCN